MKTQLAQRRASTTPVVRVEEALRNAGASVLAATGILASPWILFAIAYQTYIYFTTGTWYFLGAPTPIGMFNRVVLMGVLLGATLGATMLFSAALLRKKRPRK
ncbi:hypothetical protein AA983_04870 [Dermacoccus sp. PE3]|uniref:hypothetical protein n=1 Tax=Dermacoccus sp. PE3 TaxID=1641401 RepID=UPI00064243CD|nr:hypothetical protein [Dermacoccus sp. PE3]KLO64008.1 hypothetical protein AA983_04870 [Dermacoccus sp. PE3]